MAENNRRWFRSAPKGRVPNTGSLLLEPNGHMVECRIVDLSAGGACLDLPRDLNFPKRFEFVHGRTRRYCHLAWKRGYRIGISYEAITEKSTGEHSLSRSSTGLSRLSRERR